ncbi:hypothetical protein [Limnohabitans sp.]|uniref:hypothetical protein n=1 Tax=Limnohabitans sp. TaxID=1907725 RepID=UPI0038BDB558
MEAAPEAGEEASCTPIAALAEDMGLGKAGADAEVGVASAGLTAGVTEGVITA